MNGKLGSCDAVRDQFAMLLYGELSFDEEGHVEEHLETCAECQAALEHDGQAATCSRDRGGWHFGSSGRSSTWDLREPSVHVAAASA